MNATAQSAIDSKGVRTRRRRRLTISLRTFFVLLTAGTLWLGWKVEQAHNQREVVEAIRESGGSVVYDWQAKYVDGEFKNGKSHVFIGFRQRVRQSPQPNGPAWLQQLIGDEYFQEVEQVAFLQWEPNTVPIADVECRRWLQLLERLPKLRTLVIVRPVSDKALCALREGASALRRVSKREYSLGHVILAWGQRMREQMAKQRKSRRLVTFSLRTLFVVVTVLGFWLGVVVNRARDQREAMKAIEALGGTIWFDWQLDDPCRIEPPGPAWLRRLGGDDYFQNVQGVSFVKGPYSDGPDAAEWDILSAIPHLKRLRNLQELVIPLGTSKSTLDKLQAAQPKWKLHVVRWK